MRLVEQLRPRRRPGPTLILIAALAHASSARAAPPDPVGDDDLEGDESDESDDTREIVVEAPVGASVSARRIDATEIAAVPIRTAEDALRLAPGLVMVQHGAEGKGQQYFLRGFDAVHGIDFEVSADGIPLNEWSNVHAQGYLDLGLLIPELVTAVEVLPGSFDLGQGPFAMAGSARFELGVPTDARGLRGSLSFGSTLRERMKTHPELRKWFRFLSAADLIPEQFRPSGIASYYDPETGFRNNNLEEAWAIDDFVVDPTRLTLYLGRTGVDGDTFKNEFLMDKYGIQINKTSRNTVLFMTNIGTTRSSVAYLIEVLVRVAADIDAQLEDASTMEKRAFDRRVKSLTQDYPPLPDFSRFHDAFRTGKAEGTAEGDIRSAYFMAYDESNCDYFPIEDGSMEAAMDSGRELVSTAFIIPYPPGFPILVPGQVISKEILHFMRALDVKEIHGYRPDLGLRVFTDEALAHARPAR